MTIQWITRYLIVIGVASTVIYLGYLSDNFLSPKFYTGASALFVAWLMLPYLVWVFINEFSPNTFAKRPRAYIGFAIAIPTIGAGMAGYILLNPDPQAGFGFFYIPILQFICLATAKDMCK